jgi:hypothetical protein
MKRPVMWMSAFLCVAIVGIVQVTASAQQKAATTTKTQSVVHFEVVAVQGNTVTVKSAERGARDITVDDSFRFTVDGNPVSVHDLKPGMKGTATITTTTTVTPVVVTEVKSAQVAKVAGNSIIVYTKEGGYKMFTEEDAAKRGVKIVKNGAPADFSALREGDMLTATIVTEHPPKVMTKRQVDAGMTSPATASAAPAGGAAHAAPKAGQASASDAGMGTATSAHKKLPKTASVFPLVGAVGAAFCGLALALGVFRRRLA